MPQHKSAEKRTRQIAKRSVHNKAIISRLKTLVRKVRSTKEKENAKAALVVAVKALDQLGVKGIIPKNRASNQKSKLAKYVNSLK
ncbi:MAG: 30S ribosomal protein S20 [bacterium]